MSKFIYGSWRDCPARFDKEKNIHEYFRGSVWYKLATGYDTEFKPFPDQLSNDNWELKHLK